jgi:hypothetical protein
MRYAAGKLYSNYKFNMYTVLPVLDAILKNSNSKMELISMLCISHQHNNVSMIGEEANIFGHEEADASLISYVKLFLGQSRKAYLE